jgi:hypothetical protein
MAEWYAYLISDEGAKYLGYAWNALMFVCGGGAMAVIARLRALLPGPKPELALILDAVKVATPGKLKVNAATLDCLLLPDSELAVCTSGSPKDRTGVIYLGTQDQSDLYEPHELTRMVRLATLRREEVGRQVREQGRRLLAQSVPARKA